MVGIYHHKGMAVVDLHNEKVVVDHNGMVDNHRDVVVSNHEEIVVVALGFER